MYLKYLYKIFLIVIVELDIVLHYQFFWFRFEKPLFLLLLRPLRARIALTAHNILPYEKRKFDF
jgi:hypothetical protein